jgi:hypothetical protein
VLDKLRARITLDPTSLVLAVAAGLMLASVGKDLLLFAVGRDREITNLLAFLTFDSGTDSWMPMYQAVDLFFSGSGAPIYQTIFFDQQTKFQYPPTSLLPLALLSALGVERGAGVALMQLLTFAGVLGIAAVSAKIYLDLRSLPSLSAYRARKGADALAIAGVALGTLTFDPIMYAYEVGQIQILIDLAVGGALLLWLNDRKAAAGAVMALATLIKPQYGVVILWSLLRREHRFSLGFVGLGAPVGLVSLAVFGIREHFDYLSVVSFIGRHGEVFWANQSINGLLNRLLTDADAMIWDANAFAPHHPLVYAGSMLTTVAFVLLGLGFRPRWRRKGAEDAGDPAPARLESTLDLAAMITALTLASPIAWEHHYGVTWPMMVLALLALLELRARRPGRLADGLLLTLAASYLLLSNYWTQLFPVIDTPLEALQSYYLFGGLALMGALLGARLALDPARESARVGAPAAAA